MTNEHERMVEEIVKKLCTDYYGREIQDEEELLRTTLSTLITKVRERYLREDIERLETVVHSEAYKQMTGKSWSQLDEDGVMVGVSRQAIEETSKALDTIIHQKQEELSTLTSEV